MGKLQIYLAVLFSTLFLFIACSPKVAPSSEIAPVQKPESSSMEKWQQQWEQLVKEAKREGVISLYSSGGGPELQTAIRNTFQQRFGINVEHSLMRGEAFVQKIAVERAAGLHTIDVYFGGTATIVNSLKPRGFLDPLEPALILPEVFDPKAWDRGQLDWLDPEHLVLAFFSYPQPPIIINTEIVKSGDIKSYRDLLDLKWKGKIVLDDPTINGSGSKLVGILGDYIMGWDFVRELAKQEPIISRDKRLHVEWIARGKYPIGLAQDVGPTTEFKKAGSPIVYVNPLEGSYMSSGIGDLVLINKAPHKSAARVFINWLLTKEGQVTVSKAAGYQSGRVDIPTDYLDPALLRDPKQKYFYAYDEAYSLKEPVLIAKNREIFGR